MPPDSVDERWMKGAARTLRTVRWLRPHQWVAWPAARLAVSAMPLTGRLAGRALRVVSQPARRLDVGALDALAAVVREVHDLDGPLAAARLAAAGTFAFAGRTVVFGPRIDWRFDRLGRLWAYHLNYLDALVPLAASAGAGNPEDARLAVQLWSRWANGNPPGVRPGWEPYPTAVRAANLVRAAALLYRAHPELARRWVGAARAHAAWVAAHLEVHLGANHLWEDVVALALTAAAVGWRSGAEHLVAAPCRAQFLADGMHIERSAMYHARATAQLAELDAVCQGAFRDGLDRARAALRVVVMPDGTLARFNDSTGACPLRPGWVGRVQGTHCLIEAGYHRVQLGAWDLLWDCGEPAPPWQLGHAHADALSFELYVGGHPFLVNAGIGGYGGDPWRAHCRSVAAHNTLQLDEADPLELWGTFRVGARSVPELVACRGDGASHRLEGVLTWATLRARPRHRRAIRIQADRIEIIDAVEGDVRRAVARYLAHPEVHWVLDAPRRALALGPFGRVELEVDAADLRIVPAPFFADWGLPVERDALEVHLRGGRVRATLRHLG